VVRVCAEIGSSAKRRKLFQQLKKQYRPYAQAT